MSKMLEKQIVVIILCILALCPVPLILESSVASFFEATQPLSTCSETCAIWVQVEPKSCISQPLSPLLVMNLFVAPLVLEKLVTCCVLSASKGFTCNMCCNWVHSYIHIHSMFSNWQCSCLSAIGNLVWRQSPNLRCSVSSFFVLWFPKISQTSKDCKFRCECPWGHQNNTSPPCASSPSSQSPVQKK